jgi:Double-GTPase 2
METAMTKCPNCFVDAPVPAVNWARRGARGRPDTPPAPPPKECPACRFTYLPGWLDTRSTCLVMAGARTAGKSIFIAVMMKQLEQFGASVGMEVSPATAKVREVFEEHYLNPLYRERGIMISTGSSVNDNAYQKNSLVFTLTTAHGLRHHLVIRDVAGEDLERPDETTREQLAFFRHADGVFFLFDPLQIDEITDQLRQLVPEQHLGKPAKEVLDTTVDLVSQGSPRFAVIMSKFDTLQKLRTVRYENDYTAIMQNAGAAMFRDPGPYGSPNDIDARLLHEEVRSLLILFNQAPLVAKIQHAGRGGHRFFAVSALGAPPNGQMLHAQGIAPFRCLDPLRWVLGGTGVLG